MMKRLLTLAAAAFLWMGSLAAQSKLILPPSDSALANVRTTKFPVMKEMVNIPIPGAPILEKPQRIDGTKKEIRTELHGLIYPCLYDWDKDGKPDLLLGEFETGFPGIRVYLNKGSRKKPRYTGDYFYATDVNGDTLKTYQWCCIGIHPQVIDVDGDGYDDIISGQYNPGKISWWRGSAKGFLPCQFIDQQYYVEGKRYVAEDPMSPLSNEYWNYTTARLADFNGDGLPDLFVGGTGGYRVALNIGTREHPKFGRRELLYHVDGTVLHTYRDPSVDVNSRFVPYEVCGDGKAMLTPVDWDGDGVLDILATVSYTDKTQDGIYFFRGVRTQEGLRFEQARPLVVAKDGSKLFPGTCPQIYVCDYNGDGVNDLLLGLSIETINGFEGADQVYWRWLHDVGIEFPGKDAGRNIKYFKSLDELLDKMKKEPYLKRYMMGDLDSLQYLTLRHRGYPFVMLGKKNPVKAVALPGVALRKEYIPDEVPPTADPKEPVTYYIECKQALSPRMNFGYLRVFFHLMDGYHLYTPAAVNKDFITTKIDVELPDGLVFTDKGLGTPKPTMSGMNEVYAGEDLQFYRSFKADFSKFTETKKVPIKVKVRYQACNSQMCLPPVEEEKTMEVNVIVDKNNNQK